MSTLVEPVDSVGPVDPVDPVDSANSVDIESIGYDPGLSAVLRAALQAKQLASKGPRNVKTFVGKARVQAYVPRPKEDHGSRTQ